MLKNKLAPALLLGLMLLTPGCIGNFALTHEIWDRNMKVENKVGREALFLGLVLVPVYEVTLLADLLIFNATDLFSDENAWTSQQPSEATTDLEP